MPKRLLVVLTALGFGVFSCSVAHAQVDKILINAVSWILQKQIDALEKANDPNRSLSQFDARDGYDSRDTFTPGAQPVYQDISDFRGYNKDVDTVRQEVEQSVVPAAQ